MKVVVVGLGKMGMQIVNRFITDGHHVAVIDPNKAFVEEATQKGAAALPDRESSIGFFETDNPVVWLMIPAGVVDQELDSWLALLPPNSIMIDGGNSDFRLTKKRSNKAHTKAVQLIDIGTSGGVLGTVHGFSMMVGGDKASFESVEPLLKALSSPTGGYHYFGESGAGHYIKMVHNAIEYGVMESLAEGYRMLHEGPYKDLDVAAAGEVWQHASIIRSDLNGLATTAIKDNPTMEGIAGFVAESGEARWALEVAKELGIDLPAIQSAFDVRLASQKGQISFATKLLAALRNKFGGHAINEKQQGAHDGK